MMQVAPTARCAQLPRQPRANREGKSAAKAAARKALHTPPYRVGSRFSESSTFSVRTAISRPASRAFTFRLDALTPGTSEVSEAGPSSSSEADEVAVEVLDTLIEAFRSRKRDDWRKMLAVSVEWPSLSQRLFVRIKARAEKAEPDEALKLQRLARTLGETDKEISGYKRLFEEFLSASEEEWEALASVRRPELPPAFFDYLQLRIGSLEGMPEEKETQEVLARAAARILALVEAHDEGLKSKAALEEARLGRHTRQPGAESFTEFQELLKVGSMDEMNVKLDKLVTDGKLTPALMLTTAKMYMSVKESPYVEEDVKDIMAHLYWKMKASMSSLQPPEVRILKHVLSIEDPAERRSALEEAFTPGPELATEQTDYLSTTPEGLMLLIESVLTAYTTQQGKARSGAPAAVHQLWAIVARLPQDGGPATGDDDWGGGDADDAGGD